MPGGFGFVAQFVARAGDGESFVVEQLLDAHHALNVATPVHALPGAALDRLELRKLRLPEAQHVGRQPAQPGNLADAIGLAATNDSIVILKHAEQDPVVGPVLRAFLDRVVDCAGMRMRDDVLVGEALIFISSPNRTTPYHIDLQGILGADPDVRNGFSGARVTYTIDADATADEIRALVAQSQKRSAVYDILTNPTDVVVDVA